MQRPQISHDRGGARSTPENRALEQIARDLSSDLRDIFHAPPPSRLPGPLELAIGRLSPRQGQIVALHYYGDLSVREIAGRLDISEGTVKRTLHDARGELRRTVGQDRQRQRPRRQTMKEWHMAGSHPSQYEHALAHETTYEGKPVAELRSVVPRTDGFGTLMQTFSAEQFLEQRVRFSGALKCENVENRVGLWMRVDGPAGRMLAFDNMPVARLARRPTGSTTRWYSTFQMRRWRSPSASCSSAKAKPGCLTSTSRQWDRRSRPQTQG